MHEPIAGRQRHVRDAPAMRSRPKGPTHAWTGTCRSRLQQGWGSTTSAGGLAKDGMRRAPMGFDDKLKAELARVEKGGAEKYHSKNAEQGKMFARERVRLLLDA